MLYILYSAIFQLHLNNWEKTGKETPNSPHPSIVLEVPDRAVRQEKERKTIKEEGSYLYSQTAYVANSKEFLKQLLE